MREKEGCREVFCVLYEKYKKTLVKKSEAAEILGVSYPVFGRIIAAGKISTTGDFVTLWSIARFLVS